jgi:diguanylate cyclase (GGDEF)-like protein
MKSVDRIRSTKHDLTPRQPVLLASNRPSRQESRTSWLIRLGSLAGWTAVSLLAFIGWQALQHSASVWRSAVIIASLVTVAAIIVRQEMIVRESRLMTSRLSQQIDRDPLTGLPNRRRIQQQIDFELAQTKATSRPIGLALIDIDNFKAVNDTHGHSTGDQVLRSIAGILSGACRGSDIAARYAGDEFLLVLPGLDLADAHIVGERLLKEVSCYRDSVAPSLGFDISISVGIAVSRQCQKQAKHLIAIADDAMYDAKAAGKNQLVIVDADTKIVDIEDHLRSDICDDDFEDEVVLETAG